LTQPIACTLTRTHSGTQRERWRTLFAEAGIARIETDAGLRLSFRRAPAVERELQNLVAVEVGCCKWAEWTVEALGGELALEITSTGDGVAVIHDWFLAPPLSDAR
jgi:hypothetical protein